MPDQVLLGKEVEVLTHEQVRKIDAILKKDGSHYSDGKDSKSNVDKDHYSDAPITSGNGPDSPPQTPSHREVVVREDKQIEFLQNSPACENPRARDIGDSDLAKLKTVSRKKPVTAVPSEWRKIISQGGQLPKNVVDYARKILKINEGSIIVLFESFIDYHLKKGSMWADWSAAWREWVRHRRDFDKRDNPQSASNLKAPKIITEDDREELLRD